ncbi:MAG: hypothetical protein GY866_04105 [Proteobacteria bacterium]|nr:hypothetical protein [Pseudomonadota bacterium]
MKEEIKKTLQEQFGSLKDFMKRWNETERKHAMLSALKEQGIPLEVLREAVPDSDRFDAFDLVVHIAFDQKPLTRQERVNQVRKRNYFGKYGDQARGVLQRLAKCRQCRGVLYTTRHHSIHGAYG